MALSARASPIAFGRGIKDTSIMEEEILKLINDRFGDIAARLIRLEAHVPALSMEIARLRAAARGTNAKDEFIAIQGELAEIYQVCLGRIEDDCPGIAGLIDRRTPEEVSGYFDMLQQLHPKPSSDDP